MSELKRNITSKCLKLLESFPVILITGVRQCGKTTLSKQLRPDWRYLDLERAKDYDLITRDFDFFFKQNSEHLIIDEAQRSPKLFQEMRGVIDDNRKQNNRFILTGSSSLELVKNASESLAGRVALVELGTFKINEIQQTPLSNFYEIFSSDLSKASLDKLKSLKPNHNLNEVMSCFLKGGYPEPLLKGQEDFYNLWMDNYFNTYVQRDIRSLFPKLDLVKYQRFVGMLSNLSGTIVNRSQLGRSLDTSEVTVRDYLEIAHGSFIWRNLSSFESQKIKSTLKMPKGLFRDSGLSHYLQGIDSLQKLNQSPTVGSSFESFVIEEILKGLQATMTTNWNPYYYRTKNGAEVDLVLKGAFGTLPIEIKYGSTTSSKQLRSLTKFIKDHELPFGILINNADSVEMLNEHIIQIPATCL